MKRWQRSEVERTCGLCRRRIRVGEPMQLIVVGLTITLARCVSCTGQTPPDLPPLGEVITREPGEEG